MLPHFSVIITKVERRQFLVFRTVKPKHCDATVT